MKENMHKKVRLIGEMVEVNLKDFTCKIRISPSRTIAISYTDKDIILKSKGNILKDRCLATVLVDKSRNYKLLSVIPFKQYELDLK